MGSDPKDNVGARRSANPQPAPAAAKEGAAPAQAATHGPSRPPPSETRTTRVEVTQTTVIVTRAPEIDDYVEDLIDPEFGMAASHETIGAAGKKLLEGFNGILREMTANAPRRPRGGQDT